MIVGLPKETKQDEYRVAMVPFGVEHMCEHGHTVLVQSGAGEGSGISDKDYRSAGGRIVRSAESVFEEIRYLVGVGFRELIFFDETFTVSRARTAELCERMIAGGLKLPWTCRTRVDLVDRELLTLMKRAGCKRLQMGIESGSPQVLENMGRQLDIAQVEHGFELAREIGFERRGYFMLGYLDETPEQTEMTIDLACRMKLDWASFSRTIGLPLTPMYEEMMRRGIIEGDFWRDYTLGLFGKQVPYCQDEQYLRTMQRKAYRRFYSRPSVLLPKMRELGNAHRLKEYAQGMRLFLAIQTEANRNVPSDMWRRVAGQKAGVHIN